MKNKDNIVVAIGLIVIIGIVVWVIYGNYEISSLSAKTDEATNALLLQQRDAVIKKLVNRLKVVQRELGDVKTELVGISGKQ